MCKRAHTRPPHARKIRRFTSATSVRDTRECRAMFSLCNSTSSPRLRRRILGVDSVSYWFHRLHCFVSFSRTRFVEITLSASKTMEIFHASLTDYNSTSFVRLNTRITRRSLECSSWKKSLSRDSHFKGSIQYDRRTRYPIYSNTHLHWLGAWYPSEKHYECPTLEHLPLLRFCWSQSPL